MQLQEREPPSDRRIECRDRPIGGVHGTDDEQIARQLERGARRGREYGSRIDASRYSSRKYSSPKIFGRLPRFISSMMSTWRRPGSAVAAAASARSGPSFSSKPPVAVGDMLGCRAGDIGHAGARRAEQHDLLPFLQRVDEFLKPRPIDREHGGKVVGGFGQVRCSMVTGGGLAASSLSASSIHAANTSSAPMTFPC